MTCQCIGCDGHAAWKVEQARLAAIQLAEKTTRFEEWLIATPARRRAMEREARGEPVVERKPVVKGVLGQRYVKTEDGTLRPV